MKAALVRNTEAGLFFGEKAIGAGLADQVGSYEDALAAVTDAARARRLSRVTASAEAHNTKEEPPMEDVQTHTADAPAAPVAPAETKPAAETPDAAAIEARLRAEYEEIAAMCSLAGKPDFLSEAISKKMAPAQVRDALLAAKAQESQRTAVQSHVQAAPVGADAQLNAAATNLAASKGITFAQAYAEALKANPTLYAQYLAEKPAVRPN
jgi:hypothetical protein